MPPTGYVIVDESGGNQLTEDWSGDYYADLDEARGDKERFNSEQADISYIIRWAASDGYLYVDRDGSPDAQWPEKMMLQSISELTFADFAARYCERQEQTPEGLLEILRAQKARYQPIGWVLLECQMLDSSRLGSLTILPYGPNNTFKAIPDHPVSPHGLCSDMSVVVAFVSADQVLAHALPPKRSVST